jgi:hypothetical protein
MGEETRALTVEEEPMGRDIASEMLAEADARYAMHHRHEWQPGPIVSAVHPDTPASVILVCSCGLLARVRLPREIGPVPDRKSGPR